MAKKLVGLKIEEKVWEHFQITATALRQNFGDVMEELMRDYIIKNKATVNEKIKESL